MKLSGIEQQQKTMSEDASRERNKLEKRIVKLEEQTHSHEGKKPGFSKFI